MQSQYAAPPRRKKVEQPSDEKWKKILDAPYYEVSTFGRIRRIPKNILVYDPKRNKVALVALRTGSQQITHFLVGQLVLDAYVQKPSKNHQYPAFKDGNILNIHLDNLYWSESNSQP